MHMALYNKRFNWFSEHIFFTLEMTDLEIQMKNLVVVCPIFTLPFLEILLRYNDLTKYYRTNSIKLLNNIFKWIYS